MSNYYEHQKFISFIMSDFRTFTHDSFFNEIINNIQKINYDQARPDLVINLSDKVIFIEHFDMNSSETGNNGSTLLRILDSTEKFFHEKLLKLAPKIIVKQSTVIEANISYSSYISNFQKSFRKHYSKITNYRKSIYKFYKSEDKPIVSSFFITDSTPLGNYYKSDNGLKPLVLFHTKEFLDELSKSPNINYIFYGFTNANKDIMLLMQNNSESIDLFRKDCISNVEIHQYNPLEMIYGMKI